jgi:hypothetical protein
MPVRLSDELIDFLEGGVSITVGSRDAASRPECARGLGVTVGADRQTLTVFLNEALAGRMRADFEDNRQIAVGFSRIVDHRGVQLKGKVRNMRPATQAESAVQERYLAAFAEALSLAGLPRAVVRGLRLQPALAVELEVEDIFNQTPGAGAGRRMEAQ